MAKLAIPELPLSMDAERTGATPVQFLPSTMLSWRMPIMAISGLPAKIRRKAVFEDQANFMQTGMCQQAG